jgi:predicted flap endonuclease-1-like 5' DNA nuclease
MGEEGPMFEDIRVKVNGKEQAVKLTPMLKAALVLALEAQGIDCTPGRGIGLENIDLKEGSGIGEVTRKGLQEFGIKYVQHLAEFCDVPGAAGLIADLAWASHDGMVTEARHKNAQAWLKQAKKMSKA